MLIHRTTRCSSYGHPEVSIQFEQAFPVPGLDRMLLDHIESAVATGTRFVAGQHLQLGWATLRFCERSDRTIGVQQRALTPGMPWTESVGRALMDTWLQKEVCASFGLLGAMDFPNETDVVRVAEEAAECETQILSRIARDSLPTGFSGWSLSSSESRPQNHMQYPLLAVAANDPGLVQFLALPAGAAVVVSHRSRPDLPTGVGRISPRVFMDGKELEPRAGSYVARLRSWPDSNSSSR